MMGRKKKGADLTKVIIVVLVLAGLYLGYQQMSGDEGLVAEARHRRKKAAVKKPDLNSNFWWPPSLKSLGQKRRLDFLCKGAQPGYPVTLENRHIGSFVFNNDKGDRSYLYLHYLRVYVDAPGVTVHSLPIITNPTVYINGKKSVMHGRNGFSRRLNRQKLIFETKNLKPAIVRGRRVIIDIYGDVNFVKEKGRNSISLFLDNESMQEISYKWTSQMENDNSLTVADFNKYLRSLPIKQRTIKKNYRCI